MKPWVTAVIALLALIAGAAGGYMAGHNEPTAPQRAPTSQANDHDGAAQGHKPDPAREPAPVANAPAPGAANTGTEKQPQQPPLDKPAINGLKAFVDSLRDERPKPGNGRIWGRVTLEDGAPVAEVKVTLHAQRPAGDDIPYNPDASLEETLLRSARYNAFAIQGKTTTITDADGNFEFQGLGDYKFMLGAELEGYSVQSNRDTRWRGIKPDNEVNFTAVLLCLVDIDVRLPDGSQPTTAEIHTQSDRNSRSTTWSAAAHKIDVGEGPSTLVAFAGEYKQYVSDPVKVTARLGQPTPRLTLQLKEKPAIRCTLEVPDCYSRDRFGGVYAELVKDPKPEAPQNPADQRDYRHDWSEEPQTFTGLEPGQYRLVAWINRRALAWVDVTLGQEFKEVTLKVPEPEAAEHIIVRVLTPQGKPARRASLRVEVPFENGRNARPEVLSRPNGVFWVPRLKPAEIQSATGKWSYRITAGSDSYGSVTVPYAGDATGELEIRLIEYSSLTITIPGLAGHPQRERLRALLAQNTGGGSWTSISADGAGPGGAPEIDELVYSRVSPGSFRFTLSLADPDDGGPFGRNVIAAWEFDVPAGASTQTFAMPLFHTLTLLVPDPKAVSGLSLVSPDGKTRRYAQGEIKGRMVYAGITQGEWTVETRSGSMRVQVSGDTEITLAVQPFDCLRLSDIKAGGAIETMGLRNGDLLIAVDGEGAETTELLQLKVQGSYAKESSTWTVIRNGGQQNVVVNGKEMLRLMGLRGEERERLNMRPSRRD